MKFSLFLFISLSLHLFMVFGIGQLGGEKTASLNFSKNKGASSVKVRLVALNQVKKLRPMSEKGALKKTKSQAKAPKSDVKDVSKLDQSRGSDKELAKYLSGIRELILKHKYKGHIAERLNLKGSVMVSFQIESPNKLRDLKVIKSSGKLPLDESALQTVRQIDKLPVIPAHLGLREMTINLEMEYE